MGDCCSTQIGCCCGNQACRLCCSFLPNINESTSTRLMYTLYLLLGTGIMCMMLTSVVQNVMIESFPEYNRTCIILNSSESCGRLVGYMAIYRVALALVIFFLLFALLTAGISTSRSCRAGLHNGFWIVKLILICAMCAGAVSVPTTHLDSFSLIWMYIALIGASVFVLLQMIIIVDFSHSWTNSWQNKVRNGGSRCWYVAMVISALAIYVIFVSMTILLYEYFANQGNCTVNKVLIGINVSLCLACALISVLPYVEKKTGDARAGLLQSSVISVFVLYLTWSALSSEPNTFSYNFTNSNAKFINCVPDGQAYHLNELLFHCVGIMIMFFSIYLSITSTLSYTFGIKIPLPKTNPCECCCPVIPNSHRIEDEGGQIVIRNEAEGVIYSYTLFHVMFAMASMYLMMQLTNWFTPEMRPIEDPEPEFVKTWITVWIKIVCSWLCIAIYIWTLLSSHYCSLRSNQRPKTTMQMNENIELQVSP